MAILVMSAHHRSNKLSLSNPDTQRLRIKFVFVVLLIYPVAFEMFEKFDEWRRATETLSVPGIWLLEIRKIIIKHLFDQL